MVSKESSLSDISMFAPEIFWGQALFPFEGAVEIGYAAESAGSCDPGNGSLGIDQQARGMSQPYIIEEIDEVGTRLGLEETAEGCLCHIHQFGGFGQAQGAAEISIHKIDQLLHPSAVHIDIVGIVDLISGQGPGIGGFGQLVQDGHQFQHGVEARLQFEFFEPGRYPPDRIAGEEDTFQGLFEEAPDGAQLGPFQKYFVKKVFVKLYRYLVDLFTFAFVCKPGMGYVRADQHQFKVLDLFHAVAHDPFDAPGVLDKIQFVFLMVMHREVKFCFIPGKHRETIRLG